ncbi:MAG TPA: FHA domain-containing protein [Fimbriiglobus sp.]|nr:FHA domain-containing protein [Fimbriiglobus sp.]
MSECAEPAVAGELVVQNGKLKGQRIPLCVPVTVIGAAEWCDVRLTGEGVGDVHCVVTITPAGPALRTWHPDQTRVNAQPVTATLLQDGDALTVGPCRFKLAWHLDEIAPRAEARPAEHEVLLLPEGAFDLVGWQRSLHSQERALSDLIDTRHQQISEWFEELTDRREELRLYRARQESYVEKDKARAKRLRAEAQRLRDAARKDRHRARAVYGRFLKLMKRKWSAERQAVETERAALERNSERFAADHAKFTAEAEAYQARLQDAWELLTDGQRRLLADRQEAERTVARQQEVLDRRTTEVKSQEQALGSARERVEARVKDLLAEVARLDVRATQARAAVQKLEERRGALESGTVPTVEVGGIVVGPAELFPDRVALGEPPAPIEELMAGLMVQRQDVDREKRSLALARTELERRAGDLADQRAVVAEQVAALVVARQMWQTAECQTVAELEDLARGLGDRSLAIEDRERELACIEAVLRKRTDDLDALRERLEGWQSALSAHEATSAAARERVEAEQQAKRDHLTRWEGALAELCRKWSVARKHDLEKLRDEMARWSEAREAYQTKAAELEQQQAELAAVAARVAGRDLAAQVAEHRLHDSDRPRLVRRTLRVHQRRWESHFGTLLKDLAVRRKVLASEAVAADERCRELTRAAAEATERTAAAAAAEQAAEADRLAKARELEERATILSIEEARAKRTGQELAAARDEVILLALPPKAA